MNLNTNDTKFKYIYRETSIYNFDDFNNELDLSRVYSIAVVGDDGIEYPHPITDFLRSYRSSSMSLERERQMASTVCQFLNYILKMIDNEEEEFINLKKEGLYSLDIIHGSRFLNYCDNQINSNGARVKKDTVDKKEFTLVILYVFFKEKWVINNDLEIASYYDTKGNKKYASPFTRTRTKPSRTASNKGLRDFGENRLQLLVEFIDTAISMKKGKKIALGIALQAFGGLRRGEVVNLTLPSLSYVGKSLVCDIKDRQNHLFKKKKNLKKEQVKNERVQDILPSEYLNNIYRQHLQLIASQNKKLPPTVKDALFINQAGYPLSGKAYEDNFNKVVQIFLTRLLNEQRYEEYTFLTAKPFTTHTMRGVFTNICLDNLEMNVRLTANARGDKFDTTVQEYVEILTAKQKMERSINHLAEAVLNVEASKEIIKKWGSNK
ncbi:hypothetical protein [Solibacillus cecembensis]|uniref:hypothetical protein n=1 Tax=Solibacillus cecembensis TaxID=459347 RepID=UPI003CFCA134